MDITPQKIEKSPEELLAEDAYLTYGKVVGMKNFLGEQMPDFEALPDISKKAWLAAACYCFQIGHQTALRDLEIMLETSRYG